MMFQITGVPMRTMLGIAIFLSSGLLFAQDDDVKLFPLKVGNKWTYRSKNDTIVVEVTKAESFTEKMPDGKDKKYPGFLLTMTSGNKSLTDHIVRKPDGFYRTSTAGRTISPPLCIFKINKPGETWEVASRSENTEIRGTFTSGNSTVKVPAASFQTWTVVTKNLQIGNKGMEMESHYAELYGLVRQRTRIDDEEAVMELLKFEPAK